MTAMDFEEDESTEDIERAFREGRKVVTARPSMPVDDRRLGVAEMARDFSRWLDSTYPPGLDSEAWMRRRVTKVCEEAGEVHEAIGALWRENPRKPAGTLDDVIKELADCAGAALGAIEHLTGHRGRSLDIVTERVREVCERVGVPTHSDPYRAPELCPRCLFRTTECAGHGDPSS